MKGAIVEALRAVRPELDNVAVEQLASGSSMQASVSEEVGRFFDLLEEALESGHAEWIDPILNAWVSARLSQSASDSELLPVLQQLKDVIWDTVRPTVDIQFFVLFIESIEPIFSYAVQKLAGMETVAVVEEVEAMLLEAQRDLARLDKSKSDFIAVAAHELKTPLTLIEGYTNILSTESQDGGDGRLDILLRGITNGTHRLKEIVDDMVDVSMIDNNMLNLSFQRVYLPQLFEIAKNELRDVLAERSFEFKIAEFDEAIAFTFADSERLYQVLMNILSNAMKFTPDGGTIEIGNRGLPGFVEISISDTGIGIDPEDQTLIFDKFSQTGDVSLHSSGKTKIKGGGPGLGLPIAKGIIEAHGGAIWCESPGNDEHSLPGSTFHIIMPIREKAPKEVTTSIFGISAEEVGRLAESNT